MKLFMNFENILQLLKFVNFSHTIDCRILRIETEPHCIYIYFYFSGKATYRREQYDVEVVRTPPGEDATKTWVCIRSETGQPEGQPWAVRYNWRVSIRYDNDIIKFHFLNILGLPYAHVYLSPILVVTEKS